MRKITLGALIAHAGNATVTVSGKYLNINGNKSYSVNFNGHSTATDDMLVACNEVNGKWYFKLV